MNTRTVSTCTATITMVLPEGTSVRAVKGSADENEWQIIFASTGSTDDDAAFKISHALDALAEQLAP